MKKLLVVSLLIIISITLNAKPKFGIEVETGLAMSGYNDVRIPNIGNSTSFSLKDDLNLGSTLHARLNVHYQIHPRHRISLLATPLTLKGEGEFNRDVEYMGTMFYTGEPIEATYRFDSYRLQYHYVLPRDWFLVRSVGASIKIRDAEIALKSTGSKHASKTNTGAVPLLSLEAGYRINPRLDMVLEAEGLASPYGRAEDVFIGANYSLREKLLIKAGYRFLEGGSDNEEVYTFAAVHYAVLGFQIKL